jgi:hypothetical protein
MIKFRDTGFHIFGGQYGHKQVFQIVPHEDYPIIWTGHEPPNAADAHAYSIFEGKDVLDLRLYKMKEGLKTMGLPVGAPDSVLIFPNQKLFHKLKEHTLNRLK